MGEAPKKPTAGAVGSDYDPHLAARGANGPSGSVHDYDPPRGSIRLGGAGSSLETEGARGANGPTGSSD